MSASISVILPIRGDGAYLGTALASLGRQATLVDELIVIDDGMTEAAKAALDGHQHCVGQVRVIEGAQAGPAAARNRGLAVATGDLVGFLDDDDAWPDNKLLLQMPFLASHPDTEVVGGRIRWFSAWDAAAHAPAMTDDVQDVVHVNLGAYLMRNSVFNTIGVFDESHVFAEDVDFILRLTDREVPFSILDTVTLYYRRHSASMTAAQSPREQADFRRALFRSLGRNRGKRSEGLRSLSARLVPAGDSAHGH